MRVDVICVTTLENKTTDHGDLSTCVRNFKVIVLHSISLVVATKRAFKRIQQYSQRMTLATVHSLHLFGFTWNTGRHFPRDSETATETRELSPLMSSHDPESIRSRARPRPRAKAASLRPSFMEHDAWPLTTAASLLVVLGLIIWNINLRNDVDDLGHDLDAAIEESASLRSNANATVYQMVPTGNGPANANAQAWFSIQGSGVLSVANLPRTAEGGVYQLWYITDSPTRPIPGGTFTVDEAGQGFMLIPADVGTISSIAISEEPSGGSQSPTGPILLSSDIAGARG